MKSLSAVLRNRGVIIFSALLGIATVAMGPLSSDAVGKPKKARARGIRTIRMSSEMIVPIRITAGKTTVLNFPMKPTKVILGAQGRFAIEYVENDLAIAALTERASSNLFVYLEGRRFAFDLSQVAQGGDSIVLIRDEAVSK